MHGLLIAHNIATPTLWYGFNLYIKPVIQYVASIYLWDLINLYK